ncbi:MAG: hypothetical protein COB67_07860 [SAR324 cluster bacterium]|uniref:Copper chaperone PCu(A)C n=1 Tax=SAR324 cluster bacterium TaxID=2024889 RepID=A0A2A4T2E7_9DELT|nr:MAG: hypothetical protein COB67_07860 [SAR324 cluster bacterium]
MMKKRFISTSIAIVALSLAFSSCASQKPVSQEQQPIQHDQMQMSMQHDQMQVSMQHDQMQMSDHNMHQAGSNAIHVGMPWTRAVAEGQKTGAAYMHLHNKGEVTDYLLGVETDVAEVVEVHEVGMDDGMMTMRPVEQIELKADQMVELKPGGYHIMLIGMKRALNEGEKINLTLKFKHAGEVKLEVPVKQRVGKMMRHKMKHGLSSSKKMEM